MLMNEYGPNNRTLKQVTTFVAALRDVRVIQDFAAVETCVWEDAYGRMHSVLDIQKVLLVPLQT